ncbi:hypothetical protein SLH46_16665 [Draconibacterium sp. IB214405]|uniref:hypothetical protein n=1 Tax=Draconibacterium sp. IB214405 TaxID=3097352 RepID=UPI002A0D8A1B|nr:hypothetical protein [Draconibacterium sp. IB214405]MDX8340832.1 hypothetical protein [Draconibacterium sp. IB214405]
MTHFLKNISLVFTFLLVLVQHTKGQEQFLPFDTIAPYTDALKIINGEEWTYVKKYVGQPFFKNEDWNKANVKCDGIVFPEMDVKYNIETDDLILFVKKGDRAFSYILNKQIINSFEFSTEDNSKPYLFSYTRLDQNTPKAFYTKLYDGELNYYVRFQKYINKVISGNYTGEYVLHALMYLEMDGRIFELDTKRQLFSLLEDRKTEIKKFMKKQRIKFDHKRPEDLIAVFSYYDSLKPISLNADAPQH